MNWWGALAIAGAALLVMTIVLAIARDDYVTLIDESTADVPTPPPGRSEAEVKAKAWDEGFVAGANADMGDYEHPPEIVTNPYRAGGAS